MPVKNIPLLIDWCFLVLFFIMALCFLYQAPINLIKKRISKYSIDGLLVFLAMKFGDKAMRKRVKAATEDKRRLMFLGVYALIAGITFVYEIIKWFLKFSLN